LLQRGGKVKLIETIHLLYVCNDNAATCCKITIHRAGTICFRKPHFVIGNIRNYLSIPLTRWFTGCVNVHYKMSYAAIIIKGNYGMAYLHAWKAINLIAC